MHDDIDALELSFDAHSEKLETVVVKATNANSITMVIWEKDLGDMSVRMNFGEGSSPVLHGNKLVIIWDHQGDSHDDEKYLAEKFEDPVAAPVGHDECQQSKE